ncbi:FecR family protein [Sphingobacterium phlebotomi]|uniref:FecR family protein n=1 Tax=Sphingobacterium phlebotomi TaxID=2605433 RepID=A0A5D4H1K7_9SPHI|nr:FecR domain-containing protein [Sphingobacterium phlebotomi]TYR34508.1 FecR family protein [Sphingobacterium phlebotomi]
MDEQHIPELIEKYITGTATDQEREELLDWYRSVKHDETLWPEEEAVFEQRITRVLSEIKQSSSLVTDDTTPIRRIFPWKLISIAAVALMIIGLSTIFLLDTRKDVADENMALKDDGIKPGGSKAVLKLANGQTFALGDSLAISGIENQGTFTDKNGELLFNPETNGTTTALIYNELTTPKGGQYIIHLPDGSKISLNSESVLSFPSSFEGNERKVVLQGEAYFEVAKNEDKPFFVSTSAMEIEVLGTTFNVKGYQDEDDISTTLVEGSVKVKTDKKDILLKPGQSAILNKASGAMHTKKADLTAETAWTKGYFMFNDDNIRSIMNQLSRWYDCEVVYRGDMKDKIYSGRILRRSDITEVLNMLEQTGTIKFQIEGRRVVVMP